MRKIFVLLSFLLFAEPAFSFRADVDCSTKEFSLEEIISELKSREAVHSYREYSQIDTFCDDGMLYMETTNQHEIKNSLKVSIGSGRRFCLFVKGFIDRNQGIIKVPVYPASCFHSRLTRFSILPNGEFRKTKEKLGRSECEKAAYTINNSN